MNLFKRKMQLFCISNVMVSFACTSFLGIAYSENPEILEQEKREVELASSDTEPASRLGEKIIDAIDLDVLKNSKSETPKVTRLVSKTKTVTSVVTKKEVAKKVTYTPAKYSSVTGNAIVEYAKKYMGLRYVSGGNSLSTGTDCSGFTKLIYKEFGVTLSRSAKGQASSGTYVRKSDLQKGDLVFYGKGNGRISHVGIYIGNGQVLHESNRKDGVKISSVNMMQYITARRVINNTSVKIVEEKLAKENDAVNNSETIEQTKVDTNNTDLVVNEPKETVQNSGETTENKTNEVVKTDNNITVENSSKTEETTETKQTEVNTQVESKEESKTELNKETVKQEETKEEPKIQTPQTQEVISNEENQL